jgi:hypothetical protein
MASNTTTAAHGAQRRVSCSTCAFGASGDGTFVTVVTSAREDSVHASAGAECVGSLLRTRARSLACLRS